MGKHMCKKFNFHVFDKNKRLRFGREYTSDTDEKVCSLGTELGGPDSATAAALAKCGYKCALFDHHSYGFESIDAVDVLM
jgi:hypothetical protein